MSEATVDKNVAEVIAILNMARRMELTAIHQYMVNHYDLDDMDYGKLAKTVKSTSITEMKHAEMFAERIKELGGTPASELDVPVQKRQDITEIFVYNKSLEEQTLQKYNEFIHICSKCNDHVSKSLFQKILLDEQEHFNTFDDVNTHITTLGNNYLAQMAGGNAD